MIRQGFLLRLKPGVAEAYRESHRHVPRQVELEEEAAGVIQETIFVRGDDLFVFSVIEDDQTWDRARRSAASVAWGEAMSKYLEFGEDGLVSSTPLEEVYHHQAPSRNEPAP